MGGKCDEERAEHRLIVTNSGYGYGQLQISNFSCSVNEEATVGECTNQRIRKECSGCSIVPLAVMDWRGLAVIFEYKYEYGSTTILEGARLTRPFSG